MLSVDCDINSIFIKALRTVYMKTERTTVRYNLNIMACTVWADVLLRSGIRAPTILKTNWQRNAILSLKESSAQGQPFRFLDCWFETLYFVKLYHDGSCRG